MTRNRFASVWDAIENTPGEAANMRLRSKLMRGLQARIVDKGWTQGEAASRLGITQPRVSDLARGKINLFSLDTLVNMSEAAGLVIDVSAKVIEPA